MNIEIKKAVKAGNSSAVILPRAWLNREVRVELVKKTPETILLDVINIAKKYINIESIKGIYLVGSYARGEESRESDIDILIISSNIDRKMIHEGMYNILIMSEKLLQQKLKRDLFPIGQMIKEAKSLINSEYLASIKIKVTSKNVRWYIDTTTEKLELIKKILKKAGKVDNRVVYTLILRIRTLYITEKLMNNQNYSKKNFEKLIYKIAGKNAYEAYISVKNDLEEAGRTRKEEAEKLYYYLEKQLNDVKRVLK